MTLAQKAIQKLSAFVAGCIVFAVIWLTMNPYTLILDLLDERTVVTALGTIIAVLAADSVIGYVAPLRHASPGVKKPRVYEEEGSAYLCPNCGKTYAKPVNIMAPRTEKFLYAVCPKCAAPVSPQMHVYIQASPPPLPTPPAPAAVPAAPVDPAQAAHALGIPEKAPAAAPEPKKPRLELLPDGTIIVYPGA